MAKIVLEARNIRRSCGERELFHVDSLAVYEGEKIGLTGRNGAGKSTLLHILSGEEAPDEGQVRRFGKTAEIRQQGLAREEGGGRYQALFRAPEARESLSGGEQTRNRIAAAFSAAPRLLLADEPTTDLDEEGLRMLRKQLRDFDGTLILVSHDRSLLREFCTRIWYLENGKLEDFPGGYDDFEAERERKRERAQFEYDQYRSEQKRLKESAQRMAEMASSVKKAPSRMGNSEARLHTREYTNSVLHLSHMKRTVQNRMEKMEVKERPAAQPEIRMKLGVSTPVRARYALEVSCGRLTAGEKLLLKDAKLVLPAGSRTALTGENGCGKTTLLSALTGNLPEGAAFTGSIRFNPQVKMGWFDQHHERTLHGEKSVLDNIMAESIHPQSLARTVLSCLGFEREDAFKQVSVLSGGERAKAALARLLLMDLNLLILDEPTNHLDLFTMKALEELLESYGGTLLFVSHDETFLRRVSTRMIRFEEGTLITLEGSAEEREKSPETPAAEQDLQIRLMTLEMRMADLSARMARPRKGDRPEQLNEDYMKLAEELRRTKQQASPRSGAKG